MKVLIVGDGAREHALALMISRSTIEPRIYVFASHRNPGLIRIAEQSGGKLVVGNILSREDAVKVANEVSPDLVVVGPEEPQFHGITDVLRYEGYAVFGASSRLSVIERSKVFMRQLMWDYKIPGRLAFKAFRDVSEALEYVNSAGDVVIKPARQAGGKGVKVIADLQAYLSDVKSKVRREYVKKVVDEVMSRYNDIDYKLIVEERVDGVEYTVMTITDGYTVLPLPVVQDHPHAFDLDVGPETGGMGSIQGPGYILPFITREEFEESVKIIELTLKALQDRVGERYVGAISGQMMLTPIWGPTIIEYYSRFGDPEISNLVPIITSDFLEVLIAAVSGKLASIKLEIREDVATVVKAVSPRGYPNNSKLARGHPVFVDEKLIERMGCVLLYSGIELGSDGNLYTTGSRMAEVVCIGQDIIEAGERANESVKAIRCSDGWPVFYRSDIGSRELLMKRHALAEIVRNVYMYRRSRGLLSTKIDWIPGRGVMVYDYR